MSAKSTRNRPVPLCSCLCAKYQLKPSYEGFCRPLSSGVAIINRHLLSRSFPAEILVLAVSRYDTSSAMYESSPVVHIGVFVALWKYRDVLLLLCGRGGLYMLDWCTQKVTRPANNSCSPAKKIMNTIIVARHALNNKMVSD
jgi:hypothetical protein